MTLDFLKEISSYNVRRAMAKPGKCALLVIDMQQYFLPLASPIVGNVLSIVEACRSKEIRVIFITGVMTNCCCETTARDGFVRDYRVFFVSDATATTDKELHLASLKNLCYGFAHVLSTEELCRYIKTDFTSQRLE